MAREARIGANLNPNSLEVLTDALSGTVTGRRRSRASTFSSNDWATSASTRSIPQPGAPVFNRTVTLRDTWAKIAKKGG